MSFPRTQPLQAASIYTQQATTQQTDGIDISTLMSWMLPAMVIGMMMKMMGSSVGKKKQVTPATENPTSQPKKANKSG
jgi:hypothetical protein